jgi:hypothetical protein
MHVLPQWVNKHLLPLLIDDKQGEPKVTSCLAMLVKWMAERRDTGHWVCHCTEEFTLQRIRSLGRRDKLEYKCPQLTDLSHDPADSRIIISFGDVADLMF